MEFYWGKGNWSITTQDAFVPTNMGEGWLRVDSHKPTGSVEYTAVVDADRDGWALWVEDTASEEAQKEAERQAVTAAITALIQSKITAYNKANGVAFDNIDACTKYLSVPTYTHYAFCVAVIAWTVEVWETARQLEIDIYAGVVDKPADVDAFISLMPTFGE